MKDLDMEDIYSPGPFIIKRGFGGGFPPTQTPCIDFCQVDWIDEQLEAILLDKIKDIFEPFTLRVPFLNLQNS